MMEQLRGLQFERMMARRKSGSGRRPIWFSMDSIPEVPPNRVTRERMTRKIPRGFPRDLTDGEAPNEIALLGRHAAALVEVREFIVRGVT